MSIVEFLSQPLWQRLGLTLVHFLWQGLAIAVLVGVLVRVFRLNHGNTRYATYLLAFAAMIVCPVVTFTIIDIPISPNAEFATETESTQVVDNVSYTALPAGDILPEAETSSPALPTLTDSIPLGERISGWLHISMPWILVIWMVGVVVLSVRLLMGFVGVYRWRHHLKPLPERLAQRVASLTERLGMQGFSRVFISPTVLQAMAVGYLRPMVLLPAAMVTRMQPDMLEAIIAHELAHIRRFDLWVNLAQRVVETLLFYHPAVWWLSNCLRSERELCCDELAVKATGERLTYASALEYAGRARLFGKQPGLAVGLGQSRPMLSRVRHILGFASTQQNSRFWLAGVITILLLAALAIPTTLALTASRNQKNNTHISATDLVAKIIESERKIKDIQLHMTCTIPAQNRTFYEYDWGYDDTKEFLSGTDNRKDSRTGAYRSVKVIRAFDGKREWLFRNDPKSSRPSGGITEPNPNFSFSGGIMTFNTLLGFDAKELSRLSLGQAIAQAESVSVKEQVEFIDGRPCYVIEAINLETDPSVHWAYDVRAWIDYQRAYRPLKFEKYRSIPGKNRFKVVSRRVDNIKLEQINGIWLPIEGTRTTFSTNDIHPPKGMTAARFGALPSEQRLQLGVFKLTPMGPMRRLEIDVESIRLNKGISPEAFTIAFPKGCEVYDEFAGNRYIVGEQSEKDAALSDAELIEQTKKLSVSELIDVLRSKSLGLSKRRWFAVIHRLVEIGPPAVAQLVAEIRKTEKPQTQSKLALTLRAIGDPNAVAGLIDALERAGFSSDYGLGEPKTELGRFYKTYQMDPAKKGLGLGRPVREITIALERLTGHSEGHDHFHAYDSAGNRLGSYTITPEIRDRQRQHRRQVAQKWRTWWQANKDKIKPPEMPPTPPAEPKPPKPIKHEGMVLGAPEGAELILAIVPNIGDSARQPSLTKEQYQKYLDYLAENGPFAGSVRGDSFQWSPIKGDTKNYEGLPLSAYKERTYILLCARAQYVMIPEVEGKRIWGLEAVEVTRDMQGRDAISVRFDEKGAELLAKLTKANIDNHLALAVDGWVRLASVIQAPLKEAAFITGDFPAGEVRTLVEDLKKGMPVVDQQAITVMQQIAEAAEKLNKDDLAKMGPRQVVENLLVAGLAGDSEKFAWFIRGESVAAKAITIDDFAQMADGHKIKVLEVHADSNDALAITSNIKGKSGDREGQLIFYLSKQTGTWLIYDGDAGDSEKAHENVDEFLITHPAVQVEGEENIAEAARLTSSFTTEDILKIWRDQERKLHDIYIDFNFDETLKDERGSVVASKRENIMYMSKGNLFRTRKQVFIPKDSNNVSNDWEFSADGTREYYYDRPDYGIVKNSLPEKAGIKHSWVVHYLSCVHRMPRKKGNIGHECNLIGALEEAKNIEVTEELFEGRKAIVLNRPNFSKIYLDPTLNFAVLGSEATGEQLTFKVRNSNFVKVAESIWMPLQTECTFKQGSNLVIRKTKVNKLKINNNFTKEDFRIKFEPGTTVHDRGMNLTKRIETNPAVQVEGEGSEFFRRKGWKIFGHHGDGSKDYKDYVDSCVTSREEMKQEKLITVRCVDAQRKGIPYCRITFVDRGEQIRFIDNVATDKDGYAYCDDIDGPFSIMAQVFDYSPLTKAWRFQHKKIEKLYTSKNHPVITVQWPPFPEGIGQVQGNVKDQYGRPLKEFDLVLTQREGQNEGWGDCLTKQIEKHFIHTEGNFEIGNLTAGKYTYFVYPKEESAYVWNFDMGEVTVGEGATTQLNIEIQAKKPTVQVEGKEAWGEVVDGLLVSFWLDCNLDPPELCWQ